MRIERYSPDKAEIWDTFVTTSKNGTFILKRRFMDYHSYKFLDHSLMYYDQHDKLIAIMPANENSHTLYSHQGLTYGGLILSPTTHIADVGGMLQATIEYLHTHHLQAILYKQIPTIYHRIPSDEDTYWLWRIGATTERCDIMTAIDLRAPEHNISKRRATHRNKLRSQGYHISYDAPIETFWPILEYNLATRYGATPVHTLNEITLLKERFDSEIQCATVLSQQGETIAGTILFITPQAVRTQYISASPKGKEDNAIDYLMLELIEHYRYSGSTHYFEFGTSMAPDGISLNPGLIMQKEGFGGRSIACKTYRITPKTRHK